MRGTEASFQRLHASFSAKFAPQRSSKHLSGLLKPHVAPYDSYSIIRPSWARSSFTRRVSQVAFIVGSLLVVQAQESAAPAPRLRGALHTGRRIGSGSARHAASARGCRRWCCVTRPPPRARPARESAPNRAVSPAWHGACGADGPYVGRFPRYPPPGS